MDKNEFISELEKLNIRITDKQLKQLEEYYNLLVKWNEFMNLTGITEKKQVYLKHFYDSLTLCKVMDLEKQKTLCDIGTGAGFPGMVLKILFPNLKVTLVDSLRKRLNFLQEVINTLELKDIELIHSRAEDYGRKNREKFDVVTARAVAPINILLEYCLPLIKPNKYFIPMKGNISQEINVLDRSLKKLDGELLKKEEFLLPYEESSRTILLITKYKETNKKYPRKTIEIKRNPL